MNETAGLTIEKIGKTDMYISAVHRFGTDAILLADFAAPRHKDTVCDLCSGCGIVAVVMHERFSPKSIEAVEIDKEGTELLRLTVQKNGLNVIKPTNADLKQWKAEKELDLITCNPPYKRDGTGIYSTQKTALGARHEVLCGFADVCRAAARSLKYGGRLCICNRPERLCDIMCDMRESGIEPKRVRFVSKNPDTSPWLVLVEGRKGGKPFAQVEPNLYTHDKNGERSTQMESIYRALMSDNFGDEKQ